MPARHAQFLLRGIGMEKDMANHQSPEEMQAQVAGYIEAMSGEMLAMARAAKLEALAYFLDATRREAAIQAGKAQRDGKAPV